MNVYRVIVTILGAFSVLCAMGETIMKRRRSNILLELYFYSFL